jgi:amino acid transporter
LAHSTFSWTTSIENLDMDIEKDIVSGDRRESTFADHRRGSQFDPVNEGIVTEDVNKLKRNLHGRHMQMIAIGRLSHRLTAITVRWRDFLGGAIGAGLFVGSGGALRSGGPGSLVRLL